MGFREKTALAMEQYTNVAGIDLEKIAHMSDVDIACDFHAGVHRKLFSARDVRQLVERLDSHCKYRPQTRLFLNLYDFLNDSLALEENVAHCMAICLKMSPTELLKKSDDDIQYILFPYVLEDYLSCLDINLLLERLTSTYPDRLDGSIVILTNAEHEELYENMVAFLNEVMEIPSRTAGFMSIFLSISVQDLIKLDCETIQAKLQLAVSRQYVKQKFVDKLIHKLKENYSDSTMLVSTVSTRANPYLLGES